MRALYESPWHHPFLAYACGALLLWAIARRLAFLPAYLVVFLVVLLADATVTGAWSPVPLGTPAYRVLSVLFIVLGDLRYFLLVERFARPEAPLRAVILRASLVTLVVPLTTGVLTRVVPAMRDDRVLYVVYEAALSALSLGFAALRLRGSRAEPGARRLVVRSSRLFAGLYAGWALCDVAILMGSEAAHALRILPNVLYYCAFLPCVLLWAPPRAWRASYEREALLTDPR